MKLKKKRADSYMKLSYLMLLIAFIPHFVLADKANEYLWVTPTWKGYTQADNKGFYIELIDAVSKEQNIQITRQSAPWARCIKMVNSGRAELTGAIYNSNKDNLSKHPVIESKEGFYYTTEALNSIDKIEDLTAYNGVWINGFFSLSFSQNYTVLKGASVLTSKQAIKMLLTENRDIDYYYAGSEQIEEFSRHANVNFDFNNLHFKMLYKMNLHMKFSDTLKGKQLKSIFDSGIEGLYCQGKLKQIYDKWDKEMPEMNIACSK
jgi:ABC-type amino acid transport substrate-binding protein